ncbi:hypothetical protein LDENG_00069500 [Lucifuga dentata]|nr:hypothetical protein LDENG_00069500 [Lucifuga dentata]
MSISLAVTVMMLKTQITADRDAASASASPLEHRLRGRGTERTLLLHKASRVRCLTRPAVLHVHHQRATHSSSPSRPSCVKLIKPTQTESCKPRTRVRLQHAAWALRVDHRGPPSVLHPGVTEDPPE